MLQTCGASGSTASRVCRAECRAPHKQTACPIAPYCRETTKLFLLLIAQRQVGIDDIEEHNLSLFRTPGDESNPSFHENSAFRFDQAHLFEGVGRQDAFRESVQILG